MTKAEFDIIVAKIEANKKPGAVYRYGMQTCEHPGCTNQFPEHYVSHVCGAHRV